MVKIKADVVGEKLTLTSSPVLATNTVDVFQIEFTFDSAWDGFLKTASFWDANGNTLTATVDSNGVATIPHTVVETKGRIKFGVYGTAAGSNSQLRRIVSEKINYTVVEGAYSLGSGDTPVEPSVLEQIEALVGAIDDKVDDLEEFIGDTSMGTTATTVTGAIAEHEGDIGSMASAIVDVGNEVVGLQSHLSEYTGVSELTDFTDKKYIATNESTVDITSMTSNNQFMCGVFDCVAGDRFVITGQAGSTPRVWCFIDNSGNSLGKAANGANLDHAAIVAPENAAKLVVNFAKANTHELLSGTTGPILVEDFYKFSDARATIYPTGDTINRSVDILNILTKYGICYFAPGEYTIDRNLTLPANSRLYGSGKHSRIIYASSSTGQMIDVGNNCQISNLWFDGGLSTKSENASANRHCIRIKDNKQTLQMHNCWVTGFGGTGIRIDNTGYNQLSSIQAVNCVFQYNGYALFFMEHGEYGVVSNCTFLDNYIGTVVYGGNNIISGCAIERNSVGALVDGENVDNSGHGEFIGCSFNHNTNIGLQIRNTTNGYLVSGCQFFRNTDDEITVNATGVNISGCQFGVSSKFIFNTNGKAVVSNCLFASAPLPTYIGSAVVASCNNSLFDGTPVNLEIPRGPFNEDTDIDCSTRLSDYQRVNAIINANNLWKMVGDANWESVFIPVKPNAGITIVTKPSVNTYFGFLKNYSTPTSDALAPLSDISGYTKIWLRQGGTAITRSYIAPSDAKYFYVTVKTSGNDAKPDHLIIDGIDILTGNDIRKSIYGGSAGTLNTLLVKASKLICTIIDDDAQNVASMEKLYTECEANGVKCTIASLTDKWDSQPGLKNKLYEMEEAGYHIVLHARTQDSDHSWQDFESRVADYTQNFVRGLRDMHDANFANCDFWVTPGGVQFDGCQMLAKKYGMKALIAGVNGINIIGSNTLNNDGSTPLDSRDNSRWRIRRANLRPEDDASWTLQNLKDLALAGASHASWLILCTHSYQWTDQDQHSERLAEFITYARSLGYEFMTLGEAWEYKKYAYDLYDMT